MYNRRKSTALLLTMVMIFSIVLSPFTAAYASEPTKKLPIGLPNITPAVKTPTTKPLTQLETPARVQGVEYDFKDNVKQFPNMINYEIKTLTLDQFASFDLDTTPEISPQTSNTTGIGPSLPNVSISGNSTNQHNVPAVSTNDLNLDQINGIRYPAGSKILSIPKNLAPSFTPKLNDIYVDEEEGVAFRVLDAMEEDTDGNIQYVVETPQLTDIFESYSIPKQTLNLTTGNICYIAPEFELSPDSGMPKNYMADSGIVVYENKYIECRTDGNKHIMKLKPGTVLFEYPDKKKDSEKDEVEKKEFNWEDEQYSDLRGFEEESSLTVEVKIKEGEVVVENPKFHADFELNKWTSHVSADFYFDAKATADVTLEGNLTFNKTIEKCVYGYDIDLGKVMGKEKSNKAFVGIFLVLGVNGKVHVEVRIQTTGNAQAGFAYKAYGYGFAPYFAGPYATYKPSTFDMGFTVNGEINATLACVPQVGVIIWGYEIGQLQIWLGFKANAKFAMAGGTDSSFQGSGSIDLNAFGELVGYLFGNRYSIFYIDFPLYSGEWKVGEKVEGSGGDAIREVVPYILATADASTDVVEGKVAFDTKGNQGKPKAGYSGKSANIPIDLKPYAHRDIVVRVYDKYSRPKITQEITTDVEGKFYFKCQGNRNIIPSDSVYIDIPRVTDGEGEDITPIIEVDNKKFRVVGKSSKIEPTVPFSQLDFNVDSFNDIITGWVSGNYTGTVIINIGKIYLYPRAENGIFKISYPIDENIGLVKAFIDFEGSQFPNAMGVTRHRNLDALTLVVFNEFLPRIEEEETNETQSSGLVPLGKDKADLIPKHRAQETIDALSERDSAGRKFIKPSKVFGTISNKGDMGWLENQGDDLVRPGMSSVNLKYYNGNVTIKQIKVQSALQALINRQSSWVPKEQGKWNATTQATQAMELMPIKDNTQPSGIGIKQIPTTTGQFEFNNPDVCAYIIEIEHEGLKLTKYYNPYVAHYKDQPHFEDILGPFREDAAVSAAKETIDSVVNPADDIISVWQGNWVTQMGKMELTQRGNAVAGNIMHDKTAYQIEGTATDGKFVGSYVDESQSSMNRLVIFSMDISTDGKTINFRNFGAGARLKGLTNTTAIREQK